MKFWYVPDYAVLYLLYISGIHYEKRWPDWYHIDWPVAFNDRYELPGGFAIETVVRGGVELRATRKEQSKR